MAIKTKEETKVTTGKAPVNRRKDLRYSFTGTAEAVAEQTGARVTAQVGDLGRQGCYLDTTSPFPLHTIVNVHITKAKETFYAKAKVVFSLAGKGMGLFFTEINPKQQPVLTAWLLSTMETSWLTSNRRRSQRILVRLPVRVSGKNSRGFPFEEETYTQAISAHGAMIVLSVPVTKGQILTISNNRPKASLDCVVAHIGTAQGEVGQIGIAFLLPNPLFWHATFPPSDWSKRHEDAKSNEG